MLSLLSSEYSMCFRVFPDPVTTLPSCKRSVMEQNQTTMKTQVYSCDIVTPNMFFSVNLFIRWACVALFMTCLVGFPYLFILISKQRTRKEVQERYDSQNENNFWRIVHHQMAFCSFSYAQHCQLKKQTTRFCWDIEVNKACSKTITACAASFVAEIFFMMC